MNHPQKKIYLIRHGETEWSKSGKHTGITDIPLTANGISAAKLLKPIVSKINFSLVLTSPLLRAKETCKLAGLMESAQIDPDLMEWNYGIYEGITTKEIHETLPGWMIFRDGCPGGESPEQIAFRVDRLIAKVRAINGDVALFAHGHILRALVARWIELPVISGSNFALDTATIGILSSFRGIPVVNQWNAPLKMLED